MDALYTLIKPVVTEKATALGSKLKYAFWINRNATKIDVKRAIKEAYGADVATVRIINSPAKKRIARRMIVDKRAEMKKAIITLKGGKKLDVNNIAKEAKK